MKSFPLQPLVNLAQDELDRAARELSALRRQLEEEQGKLAQLQRYREEYREKLFKTTWAGLAASQLRDYEAFIAKLSAAIQQQEEVVALRRGDWEAAQSAWLAKRRKVNAYDTLWQRHAQREQQREARMEQRDQDEHARKLFGSANPAPRPKT